MPDQKLSDSDVARLREMWLDGWTARDLAAEFFITRQHVGRLTRGEQRAQIGGLDAEALRAGVTGAVGRFLADVDLDAADNVMAVTAHGLAAKLDAVLAADSAAAAQAAPRLAAQLIDVLERLRGSVPREADGLDLLRRRRAARLLTAAARNGDGVA